MIVDAIFRNNPENPKTDLSNPDSWYWDSFGSEPTSSGLRVNRNAALGYAAVWKAQSMISRDVAKTPLNVYRRGADGAREKDSKHPAFALLRRRPNQWMTAFAFRQTLTHHVLMHGNGYAYIYRNGRGDPMDLVPLAPEKTYPVLEGGDLKYITEVEGGLRKLDPFNVLHIKGMGADGLVGYSVLHVARESLGIGIAARQFGSVFFRNRAVPSMVIEVPGAVSDEQIKQVKDAWNRLYSGLDSSHKVAVLKFGAKITPLAHNAKDSQLLETRQFEVREVANWFGVPPHKLGDTTRTAYASLEQENQSYLDEALDGWFVAWEEECAAKLLTDKERENDTHFVEFMRSAIVRADIAARFGAYNTAINGGWMSPDEARAKENDRPIEGGAGKWFRFPLNMGAIDGGELINPNQTAASSEPDQPDDVDPEPEPTPTRARVNFADIRVVDGDERALALKQIFAATAGRMARRIGLHARKAGAKPDSFVQWVESIDGEHGQVIQEALDPICRAMFGCTGTSGVDWRTRIVSAWQDMMLSAAECAPKDLPNRVDAFAGIVEKFCESLEVSEWNGDLGRFSQ